MMNEDPIITEEKMDRLSGIFSDLSPSVIRNVLHHPDVAGNIELAGQKLAELMGSK